MMLRAVQASAIAFLAAAFPANRTLAGASAFGAQPISIEVSEDVSVNFVGAPRLQSFAWTRWDHKWIFIGDRIVQQDDRLPAYVGTNSVFLPAASLKRI